eukprot:TRINITY_DN33315_c0_g1_i1.p1 TRINITY_DN33315_c0_g1~~TRINITY_DN33315_c0_g1_i1.p1  ORF type:complete len:792 (-),score=58.87 TRINITY_DN33315_c0_g1_i1:428-2722(-)
MVGPLDLLSIISNTGVSIQGFFSWSGYNRDNFGLNVTWRQMALYQQKNYYLNWVSFAREDLTSMKGVSVHHTANHLMVSTLMLSSTILAFAVAGFSPDCPTFVEFAFYTSGATAVVFLMMAIMFGIKSQASAYENTIHMLTTKIRPHNPAREEHDYMNQVQWLEKQGLQSMLRKPGVKDAYGTTQDKILLNERKYKKKRGPSPEMIGNEDGEPMSPTSAGSSPRPRRNSFDSYASRLSLTSSVISEREGTESAAPVADERAGNGVSPPLEVVCVEKDARYLSTFQELMRTWKPHEDCCKICMGLGTVSFAQSSCYFTIGKVVGVSEHYLEELLSITVSIAFMYMMIVILSGYRHGSWTLKAVMFALVFCGQSGSSVAAVTSNLETRALLIPSSFFFHFLFWLVVFGAACSSRGEIHPDAHASEQTAAEENPPNMNATSFITNHLRSVEAVAPGMWLSKSSRLEEKDDAENGGKNEYFSNQDVMEFGQRAARKQLRSRRALSHAAGVCCLMWLSMTTWALIHYSIDPWLDSGEASATYTTSVETKSVEWPNPLFHPHTIACTGSHVFVADHYNIYRIFPWGGAAAINVPCRGAQGEIQAISVFCEGRNCHPVALVDSSNGPTVVNCSMATPLSGDGRTSAHLAVAQSVNAGVYSEPKLLTTHAGELVQYEWSDQDGVWQPEWGLGRLRQPEKLQAIASAADAAMLFYSVGTSDSAIEVLDLQLGTKLGRWTVPTPVLGGCATGSKSALLLTTQANQPVVLQATLS